MSTTANRTAAAGDANPEPGASPTPTVTHYQQLADQFSKALDDITAIIPKLESSHAATRDFVRSHVNVSTEFLATAIAAVDQVPELQNLNKLDTVAARDTLQFIEAFRPVQDKVTAFAHSLKFTMMSRKATLAADALQIYDIVKGLARDPGSAGIASLVGNLKRDLGRRGRPKTPLNTAKTPPPILPLPAAPA